ncbi:hypothetical protein LCGC14_0359300 [marine sediment metagenome]|uniref:Uncharacterized protein n=1 Tax=marine sediment metagenome TaxID=412755 RepID=A0A0F9T8G4_9ZZZZ
MACKKDTHSYAVMTTVTSNKDGQVKMHGIIFCQRCGDVQEVHNCPDEKKTT